jgi:hypothetical protein
MIIAYRYAKKKHSQRQKQQELSSDVPAINPVEQRTAAGLQNGWTELEDTRANGATATQDNIAREDLAEKKRKRKYRWKVLLGLALPFALQALDMTIIASALPYIATDFSKSLRSS